jgi:kexin
VPQRNGQTTATTETSNFDGYVNKRGIITVCSTNDRGTKPQYTEAGSNVLVCSPIDGTGSNPNAVTTDINPLGGNLDSYTDALTGTSFSAPAVSGVVALMLAANPNLTWRDVQQVLVRTARENDSGSSSWLPSSIPNKRYSHDYGWGTVDAAAAVAAARTWQSIGNSSTQKVCGPYERTPNLRIPDSPGAQQPGVTVTDNIDISNCDITRIEFVEITFSSSHTYSGDLSLRLIGPGNRVSELANNRSCGSPSGQDPCRSVYDNWQFSSVRHLDEAVNGRWQISATDNFIDDTGNITRWSLRFYGR